MNALSEKITFDTVIKAYNKKGYKLFDTGDYNLNIFGVRSKDMTANSFNDVVGVLYRIGTDWILRKWDASTDAGTYYRLNPMNANGCAIVAPGQYPSAFKIGYHKGQYKALVQNKPLLLYRDADRDNELEYVGEPSWEMAGINLHRANANVKSKQVDRFSAGCTVIADPGDFTELLNLVDVAASMYGDTFTYTLFEECDLDA